MPRAYASWLLSFGPRFKPVVRKVLRRRTGAAVDPDRQDLERLLKEHQGNIAAVARTVASHALRCTVAAVPWPLDDRKFDDTEDRDASSNAVPVSATAGRRAKARVAVVHENDGGRHDAATTTAPARATRTRDPREGSHVSPRKSTPNVESQLGPRPAMVDDRTSCPSFPRRGTGCSQAAIILPREPSIPARRVTRSLRPGAAPGRGRCRLAQTNRRD